MEVEIVLRQLGAADVDAVARVEKICFTDPWSRESLNHDILENPAAFYLGAFVDETLLGFGGMWVTMEDSFITTISILPEYRGNGAGSFLLSTLMDTARALGAMDMTLEVRVSNLVAQRMYAAHGFTAIGVRKKYYPDNGEDAFVMWCPLSIAP